MDAPLWAILTTAATALALLAAYSPQYAAAALRLATGLGIATALVFLPLLLARS